MKTCPKCEKSFDSNKRMCKACLAAYEHSLYEKNRELRIAKAKERNQKNKDQIRTRRNEHEKRRRKADPVFRLRKDVSRSVWRALKKNFASKRGRSIMSSLSYSMSELKDHLEKQFEPWMNWNNRGPYNPKIWDDNDSSTWTWQIDHIIPQSSLPYTSMSDENFHRCWALSNLRPLSSRQNIIEGSSQIRHI